MIQKSNRFCAFLGAANIMCLKVALYSLAFQYAREGAPDSHCHEPCVQVCVGVNYSGYQSGSKPVFSLLSASEDRQTSYPVPSGRTEEKKNWTGK